MHTWHKIRRQRFHALRVSLGAGLTADTHFKSSWQGTIRETIRFLEHVAISHLGNSQALLTLAKAFRVQ